MKIRTMASSEVEEERPELAYYEDKYCESCQQLDKKVMKEEYDDKDYLYEDDDFRNDETLKLHVIHYRRSVRENGLFYFGCPPLYDNLHARPQYPRQHFIDEPDFEEIVEHCALFAVGTYNEKLDAEMELVEIENASFEGWGRRRFYMVIRCSDDGNRGHVVKRKKSSEEAGTEEAGNENEKTFRVVVSCCWWRRTDLEVLVFKDSDGTTSTWLLGYEVIAMRLPICILMKDASLFTDLLDADPEFDRLTKPQPRRSAPLLAGIQFPPVDPLSFQLPNAEFT